MPRKKPPKDEKQSDDWLPKPDEVVEEFVIHPPGVGPTKVIRSTIQDPTDKPPKRKKRS